MERPTLLSDLLEALGVPHTRAYSDMRFRQMTFKSLFGLSKVLEEYGVESRALAHGDKKADLKLLTTPFLAASTDGFAIVYGIDGETVDLSLPTGAEKMPLATFLDRWTGTVLLLSPHEHAHEPDLGKHRFYDYAAVAKRWILGVAMAFFFFTLFFLNGICGKVSTILLAAIDVAGLFVTYHLLLKSRNVHSDTGDRICGIIDRTGCSTVLKTSASSFFGLFSWSEVGVAYFSVSLLVLLLFPEYTGYLALINACCCPFSIWSVWYQKYRAKAWCTLCLITQACLWLSLFCYIGGGWFRQAFPLSLPFFIICAAYVIVLFILNASSVFSKDENKN